MSKTKNHYEIEGQRVTVLFEFLVSESICLPEQKRSFMGEIR